jgi:Domain of unknown function (DUF4269)
MMWHDFSYLQYGTARQREAYACLQELGVMTTLKEFHPTLVSTICIDIDVETSDLDVICQFNDCRAFSECLRTTYKDYPHFVLSPLDPQTSAVVARFESDGFLVEVFGQPLPVWRQNAYRHLTIMARLLSFGGDSLREAVRELKRRGVKSEAAFASCLGLGGDPYLALFALESLCDSEIAEMVAKRFQRQ